MPAVGSRQRGMVPAALVTSLHDRWLRIVSALADGDGAEPSLQQMCLAAEELLAAGGVGILVMAVAVPGATCASNAMAAELEDLQLTLGVGPGFDAHRLGVPVTETDLAAPPDDRWVGYRGPAVAAGARAVFSFPMRVGAARVGALTVYNAEPGSLADEVQADAVVLSRVVTNALLATQAGLGPGALGNGFDDDMFDGAVHQAAGMVSVQLGVDVGEALARLRARAFADGVTLSTLAADVVSLRIRLDDR